MKSDWLPTMPVPIAIWSQLTFELDLDWADQGMTVRLLANAWSSGALARKTWATDAAWLAASRMWPGIEAIRSEAVATRERLAEAGRRGNEIRWRSPGDSPPDSPRDRKGSSNSNSISNQKQKPNQKQIARKRADTWLTPFGTAWRERYGGEPPWGRLGSALAELCERHGAERVLVAWGRYLLATEGEFASPQRFASTFGRWDGTAPAPQKLDAPRQNVPTPAAPDPEFRARYEESMRRRRAPRCAQEPSGATIVDELVAG